jgi:hypothetical protein
MLARRASPCQAWHQNRHVRNFQTGSDTHSPDNLVSGFVFLSLRASKCLDLSSLRTFVAFFPAILRHSACSAGKFPSHFVCFAYLAVQCLCLFPSQNPHDSPYFRLFRLCVFAPSRLCVTFPPPSGVRDIPGYYGLFPEKTKIFASPATSGPVLAPEKPVQNPYSTPLFYYLPPGPDAGIVAYAF